MVGKNTLVFTETPEIDILIVQNLYEDEDRDCFLGYELPQIVDFSFLGKTYKAISFWHDNEDIEEIELDSTK